MQFVLDNSVVCGWFLQNQATPYSDAIIERLRDERAAIPALWELEFTKVLRSACLRQRMTAEGALLIIARNHRTQEGNRRDALERLDELIARASVEPKKRYKTRPTFGSKQRRLEVKTQRKRTKQLRGRIDRD